MIRYAATGALLHFTVLLFLLVVSGAEDILSSPASGFLHREETNESSNSIGTRWAVLVAGSKGYWNYRHQADVCHAYQLLKRGGLPDENIIVFMYDDIANNSLNPRPGVLLNSPKNDNVYEGVPKDYTGDDVNANNFYAALLGNKSALAGGSRKVVNSGPNDHIFVYYTDHGGPGVLEMPWGPNVFSNDLVEVLKKKHASGTYKRMVMYIEACESGSMFKGLLPEGLNIYVNTASGVEEASWCWYCAGQDPSPPPEYKICLGDLYSATWMEEIEMHNLRIQTLSKQYESVRKKIAYASNVTEFGDLNMSSDDVFLYLGTNPANDSKISTDSNSLHHPSTRPVVNQRDADLWYFQHQYDAAPQGTEEKLKAEKQLSDVMSHRIHIDNSMKLVGNLLFGAEKAPEVFNTVRPAGQPLVDDWDCLKSLVRAFETRCGSLSQYGLKDMDKFANMCNAGTNKKQMAKAAGQACPTMPSNPWSSLISGFSA